MSTCTFSAAETSKGKGVPFLAAITSYRVTSSYSLTLGQRKFKPNFLTACYKFGNISLEILSGSIGVYSSEVLK